MSDFWRRDCASSYEPRASVLHLEFGSADSRAEVEELPAAQLGDVPHEACRMVAEAAFPISRQPRSSHLADFGRTCAAYC